MGQTKARCCAALELPRQSCCPDHFIDVVSDYDRRPQQHNCGNGMARHRAHGRVTLGVWPAAGWAAISRKVSLSHKHKLLTRHLPDHTLKFECQKLDENILHIQTRALGKEIDLQWAAGIFQHIDYFILE
jgi:hypothetical protein